MTPLFSVKQSTKTTPAANTVQPISGSTAVQAAAAFSAHLKKSQAEQANRAARQHRREAGSKSLTTREAELQQSALFTGEAEIDDLDGQDQQAHQEHRQQQPDDEQNRVDLQEDGCAQVEQRLETLSALDELATEALAEQLAQRSNDDGMFEILQSDGDTLSVAITQSAGRVSLLLGTSSVVKSAQLLRSKMELEQRLGRRIGKDVVVAVL